MYELFRHYFSHPCGRERRESVEMEGLRVGRTCSDNYRSYSTIRCGVVPRSALRPFFHGIRASWQGLPWCNLGQTNLREFFRPLGRSRLSQPFAGYRCSAAKEMF